MNLEVTHKHYLKAKKIIDYYDQYKDFIGDILVFLPGLSEIN
jgi:HrpA-like RNA helicase